MRQENEQLMPRARKADLVVRELPDEVLVYDLKRDKAHCLNPAAAFVWRRCNGRRSVSEVARALAKDSQTPADVQIVWLALDQLDRFHLLEERIMRPAGLPRVSRRDIMRLGAAAAVALPAIISIVAPTAANAQTAITPAVCGTRRPNDPGGCGGTPCTTRGTCRPTSGNSPCTCQ